MMLALLLAAAALVSGPASETPRQFMTRVYAQYRHKDFSPFTHPERYFSPRLRAAIAEDARLAHGEVGYVDGDPICQCQDAAGMRPSVTAVAQHGANATVRVTIGWENDPARPATFTLVRTPAGWRIADVGSADEPSLLGAIEKSNRELSKQGAH
jgi:hypothetical protein